MPLPTFIRGAIGFRRLNVLVAAIEAALALKAPLASPTFTGTVTVTGKRKNAPSATPANITTAGAETLTAANLATGVITRDPNGTGRTDTTDTAANLIAEAGLNLSADYQERECLIVNRADAAETITLAGGTGVTLKGTITIERYCAVRIAILRTSATTVCIRQV